MWCIAWWHSGREDEDEDDEEIAGPESSRTGVGFEETLTPLSAETPLPSTVSRCPSLNVIQATGLVLDKAAAQHEYKKSSTRPGDHKTIPSDSVREIHTIFSFKLVRERDIFQRIIDIKLQLLSLSSIESIDGNRTDRPLRALLLRLQVYTILIKLPSKLPSNGGKYSEGTSIKMIYDEPMSIQLHNMIEDSEDDGGGSSVGGGIGGGGGGGGVTGTGKVYHLGVGTGSSGGPSPSAVMRRPSQMPDIRIPLNAKNIPKALTASRGMQNKQPNKKEKKEKKAERKAAKTLSAILLAFIITWTPYNILVLLKSITACSWYIPQELWDFFYYLCYINSTVNPMCYALCNAAFRRTYVRILKCKWRSRNRSGAGNPMAINRK